MSIERFESSNKNTLIRWIVCIVTFPIILNVIQKLSPRHSCRSPPHNQLGSEPQGWQYVIPRRHGRRGNQKRRILLHIQPNVLLRWLNSTDGSPYLHQQRQSHGELSKCYQRNEKVQH